MFVVKTRLGPSHIEGLGVFADEDIAKGAVVWKFVPKFDLLIDPKDLPGLPKGVIDYCERYAYLDERLGKYVVCCDDARFVNHAEDPNTQGVYPPDEPAGIDVAARDIACGEEITCNYGAFDAEFVRKMELDRQMLKRER